MKARIADAHIIGIRSRTHLTADVLEHAKRLIAVGCYCIGTNQVDLGAAERLGVPVFNAPYSNTRSVAELVIAETIMLLRGIPQQQCALPSRRLDEVRRRQLRSTRQGHWHRRLRPHRHTGRRAGRKPGHARDFPRHRIQALARQCARCGQSGRLARTCGCGHAARAGNTFDAN